MNILPKKRWHVRTKDNIARVRRDQAAAAAEEKIRQDKLEFAESEARINFLRRQSGLPEKLSGSQASSQEEHDANSEQTKGVDLFADYRSHVKTTNKDLEKEQKEEQEKYEKQIGYLTYLGQDTNEALKVRSWYEVAPKRPDVGDTSATESHLKQKLVHDPLTLINALLPPAKKDPQRAIKRKRENTRSPPPSAPTCCSSSSHKVKKHKKEKKRSKESVSKVKKHKGSSRASEDEEYKQAERYKREKLERLRKERLRREAAERERSEALFTPKEAAAAASAASTPAPTPRVVQKYNSQFNPEIAKQNML